MVNVYIVDFVCLKLLVAVVVAFIITVRDSVCVL